MIALRAMAPLRHPLNRYAVTGGALRRVLVEHLTRGYGDFTAVDDVSFTIGRGEVVGLLGQDNGRRASVIPRKIPITPDWVKMGVLMDASRKWV